MIILSETIIRTTPEKLVALVCSPANWVRLHPQAMGVYMDEDCTLSWPDAATPAPGETFYEKTTSGLWEWKWEPEVFESSYGWYGTTRGLFAHNTYRISLLNDTEVQFNVMMNVTPETPIARLALFFSRGSFRRAGDQYVENAKAALEGQK